MSCPDPGSRATSQNPRVLAEPSTVCSGRGGPLWLTAPFFYAEHERLYDFFRYTQFGLRHLLESVARGC